MATNIVAFEDQLAALASESLKAEQSSSLTFLSTQGGVLKYRGDAVAGNALPCVILAAPVERLYYSTRFDPTKIVPPDCVAIGVNAAEMGPPDTVEKKQSDKCSTCPKNEWGSSTNGGKGKACRETRRLLLIPADSISSVDAIQTAEVAALRPPVTSLRNYANYVQTIAATLKRPPLAVITEISVSPDPKTQFKVNFKMLKAIEDAEIIGALLNRSKSEIDRALASAGVSEEPHNEASAESDKF
jgi:hypothetical protein